MFEFKLVCTNQRSEIYESEQVWQNRKVTFVIKMQWNEAYMNSCRRPRNDHWDIYYYILFNGFSTSYIREESIKERKTARILAKKLMECAAINDIDMLLDFERIRILKDAECLSSSVM